MNCDKILKIANYFHDQIIKLAGIECYHVSESDFEVGEIYSFDPSLVGKGVSVNKEITEILEKIRKKQFPNKPSRLSSFYCSPFKKSHWLEQTNKNQKLYKVETVGEFHVGDTAILNEIMVRPFLGDKLAEDYWIGKSSSSASVLSDGLEILTPKIKIIEKYENELNKKSKTFILKKDLRYKDTGKIISSQNYITIILRYELKTIRDDNYDIIKEIPHTSIRFFTSDRNGENLNYIMDDEIEKILKKDIFTKRFEYVEPINEQ